MQMGTLGPLPSVLIMEVSLFSSVLINRFHCNYFSIFITQKALTVKYGQTVAITEKI